MDVEKEKSLDTVRSPWFPREEQFIAFFNRLTQMAGVRDEARRNEIVDAILQKIAGPAFKTWTLWHKWVAADILEDETLAESEGDPHAPHAVVYIPGIFDGGSAYRTDKLLESRAKAHENGNEYWISLHKVYSPWQIERIRKFVDDTEAMLRTRLEQGGKVTILGYSCGGLIGKVLADRLVEEYPGKIGLVVHNSPIDPKHGLYVRSSNMEEVQEAIGFTGGYEGKYPLVILHGSDDMIVPCQDCVHKPGGELVKSKSLPGAAHDSVSCMNAGAVSKIRAALRAVRMHMNHHDQ